MNSSGDILMCVVLSRQTVFLGLGGGWMSIHRQNEM